MRKYDKIRMTAYSTPVVNLEATVEKFKWRY